MTDGLRKSHLRKAPQVGLSEVGLPDIYRILRYWLVLGGTGSDQGGTGCQHVEFSENILFAWSKLSNH